MVSGGEEQELTLDSHPESLNRRIGLWEHQQDTPLRVASIV
jgi:hypothetical protein